MSRHESHKRAERAKAVPGLHPTAKVPKLLHRQDLPESYSLSFPGNWPNQPVPCAQADRKRLISRGLHTNVTLKLGRCSSRPSSMRLHACSGLLRLDHGAGRLGVCSFLLDALHERWAKHEVIKLHCHGRHAANMQVGKAPLKTRCQSSLCRTCS